MLRTLLPVPAIVFASLSERGVNLPQLLASLDIDPLLALQRAPQLERNKFYQLLDAFWLEVGDPAFGFHAGQQVRPKDFGLIDYAAMNSATWGQALRHMVRYKRLVGEASLTINGDNNAANNIDFVHFDSQMPYAYSVVEYCFSHFISFGRWLCQPEMTAQAVFFKHAAAAELDHYQQFFGCPVLFEQKHDRLVLNDATMAMPIAHANPELEQQFVQQAEHQLANINTGISDQVLAIIGEQLGQGIPDINQVSQQLNLSPRTLQRRLKTENTRFLQLLEQSRKRAALTYVRQQQLDLAEVSHLLGFADVSSFYRAFKRWTGHAPLAYRDLSNA